MLNYLLFLGIATTPLYIFSSGGVQISHGLLIIACVWYLLTTKVIKPPGWNELAIVCVVALISELAYGINEQELGIINAVYFIYNLVIFTALYDMFSRYQSYTSIVTKGVVSACIVAFCGLLISGLDLQGAAISSRAIGTFNNPNQLGHFSCLLFSILVLLTLTGHLNKLVMLAAGAVCVVMAAASLSKAAMVAIGLPFLAIMFVIFDTKKAVLVSSVTLFSALGYVWLLGDSPIDIERFLAYQRLSEIGSDHDDNLASRGYFLLGSRDIEFMDYLVGLSYNGVLRVNYGDEIHSTFAFVFGTYGVIAGFAYLILLTKWLVSIKLKFSWIGVVCIVCPVFLFGITHTGVRFTFFYILLALSFSVTKSRVRLS